MCIVQHLSKCTLLHPITAEIFTCEKTEPAQPVLTSTFCLLNESLQLYFYLKFCGNTAWPHVVLLRQAAACYLYHPETDQLNFNMLKLLVL